MRKPGANRPGSGFGGFRRGQGGQDSVDRAVRRAQVPGRVPEPGPVQRCRARFGQHVHEVAATLGGLGAGGLDQGLGLGSRQVRPLQEKKFNLTNCR